MLKPTILVVDDDRTVLSAIERDLRRGFGKEYRILSADDGPVALSALNRLKSRAEPVALLLVDQRMPEMTGVEFLAEAIKIYPGVKRALLTAYADTQAAIRAINEIRLDYYLMKPWDPPEERLFPVLEDLLGDWRATFRPPFEGLRVLGYRWSPHAYTLREFLARNQIPFRFVDVDAEEGQDLLSSAVTTRSKLPLVLFEDGTSVEQPTTQQIAEKMGLRLHAGKPFYDLIIVGAGPAGLAAAVYGASEGLRTLLIEREAPGGQAGTSSRIENYLGFPVGLSGSDFARRAAAQAARFGAEILTPQEVVSVEASGQYRLVHLADGSELSCHALLAASGVTYRKLDVPGVERLTGSGVYYGAALPEIITADDQVYMVGGGNSAGQAAVYLARFARRVTVLVRDDSLAATMSRYLVDQLAGIENVEVRFCHQVTEARGSERLESLVLTDLNSGTTQEVPATTLFVFIGAQPHTEWLGDLIKRNPSGYILTGSQLRHPWPDGYRWGAARDPFFLEASIAGVFAAGDVRFEAVKRIGSAIGDGAMAVQLVHRYLASV